MSKYIIECRNVSKRYQQGDSVVSVLSDINLTLEKGKSLSIMGASGSGKSTLLNLLGGLDRPTQGEIYINEQAIGLLNDTALAKMRNREIGFVYQLHHLLMEFTALENVMMPLLIRGQTKGSAEQEAIEILRRVGLTHRHQHKPSALSGGERQRVAIARALVTHPSCVLMDEPTGNLDVQTAAQVLSLIRELQQQMQLSFVVVTHDKQLAANIGPVLEIKQGKLQSG